MERLGIARAPEDLEVLEFAVKWKLNPADIRKNWSVRDMRWVQLVEEAHYLAEPEIAAHEREKAAKEAKKKNPRKRRR